MAFSLLPKAALVLDERNARHALRSLVGSREFHDRLADALLIVVERHAQTRGVTAHACPVALEGKRLAAIDAQRREDTPAHEQPNLPGGKIPAG